MKPSTRHAWVFVVVVMTGVAGACTRSGGAGSTAPAQAVSAQTRTASASPGDIRKAEDILAELEPNGAADKFRLDLARQTEELIADCMAVHGFRYRPKDPRTLVDTITDTDFASLNYARIYGFGVTAAPVFLQVADPNTSYLDALGQTRRQLFEKDLAQCAGEADADVRGRTGLAEAEQRIARTDQRVRSDAEHLSAQRAWARCAAAVGYPHLTRLDLISVFDREREAILTRLSSGPKTQDAVSRSGSSASGSQLYDPASLAEKDPEYRYLRHRERAAAVATFRCSQDLDRVYRERYRALR